MGQDDRCGICGKGQCKHLKTKEHPSVGGAALCKRKDVILFTPGVDVDPDNVCKDCKAIAKEKEIPIFPEDFECDDYVTEVPST